MLRLGATASDSHMTLCRELEKMFRRHGIAFDWVLSSGYDAMVDAFARKEIDLAWNGPLSYVVVFQMWSELFSRGETAIE
jgi:ABC-type phosphate/phosphonate transport system substrate-binding protein